MDSRRPARTAEVAKATTELQGVWVVWDRARSLLTQIETRLEFAIDPSRVEDWNRLEMMGKRLKAALERVKLDLRDMDLINAADDLIDEFPDYDLMEANEVRALRKHEDHGEYFRKLDKVLRDIGAVATIEASAEWLSMSLSGRVQNKRHKPKEGEKPEDMKEIIRADGKPIPEMKGVVTVPEILARANKLNLQDRRRARAAEKRLRTGMIAPGGDDVHALEERDELLNRMAIDKEFTYRIP